MKRLLKTLASVSLLAALQIPAVSAQERLDRVRSNGTVNVCIWPGYYAISFRNPRNGELEGIDIDLAAAFAKDLGVKLQFVESSFGTFMDDIEQDKCDVAMFGIGDTPARRQRVDISIPHLRSGMYGVTTKTSTVVRSWVDIDRPGQAVAVQIGTVMEPYMRENLKHAQLVVVRPPATREEELLAGRVDVFMTDYPYAQRMRFQHDWAQIISSPTPVAVANYGYAVKKGNPAWLEAVNQFIQRVRKDGRLKSAAERHSMLPIAVLE